VPDDPNVVLVSNRGPVSFQRTDGDFELKRGAGGLAGALDPVARELGEDAVWIAATTSDDDREAIHAGAADGLAETLGYPVYLLDIDTETYARYYDICSNRMLWFANHCLWDEVELPEFGDAEKAAWDQAYEPVNQRFADAVCEVADDSSLVLFQDYHLYLTPGLLRRRRPEQTILHFTHSSFCKSEGLDRLPAPLPSRVIEGMLGADLLGFHVAQWVDGFLECAQKAGAKVDHSRWTVEHEGRTVWVREYPIQVDSRDLLERAGTPPVKRWAEKIRQSTDGPLIVRADRTEPSKNIIRGFRAFERLLERRPELAGDAHFVACLYPSRQSMPEYRSYRERIEQTVDDVNRHFPGAIDLYLKDDFDRTVGAYLVYDVLLVNSLMDGMNLVSKEGPIVNERSGALVLSQGAGSFEEMGDAAVEIVDALSIEKTAEALEKAIDMSIEERTRRAEELRRRAQAFEPGHWIETQLEDLKAIGDGGEPITQPR
jgi:trehalose 6-phosphate synthase